MTRMPSFDEIRADFERGIRTAEDHIEHPFHRAGTAPQTPATTPATLATAPAAAATQQGEPMSLFEDAEGFYASAKTELGKFEQALPGVLAKAKQLETSPFAQLAEKTAASVLPPEAVAIAVNAADKVLDDLIGLYTPQAATPAQQTVPA